MMIVVMMTGKMKTEIKEIEEEVERMTLLKIMIGTGIGIKIWTMIGTVRLVTVKAIKTHTLIKTHRNHAMILMKEITAETEEIEETIMEIKITEEDITIIKIIKEDKLKPT